MWNNLFGSVNLLKNGMDASWLRHDVITNNIANAETVGFKASEVQFEDAFAAALNGQGGKLTTTHEKHISLGSSNVDSVQPKIYTDVDTSMRFDENNVDPEQEMVAMAKNTIEYYALTSKINSEFKKLNTAINIT